MTARTILKHSFEFSFCTVTAIFAGAGAITLLFDEAPTFVQEMLSLTVLVGQVAIRAGLEAINSI